MKFSSDLKMFDKITNQVGENQTEKKKKMSGSSPDFEEYVCSLVFSVVKKSSKQTKKKKEKRIKQTKLTNKITNKYTNRRKSTLCFIKIVLY